VTDLDALLRERFGFDHFRPGQRGVVEAVLAGQDQLVIQPTGHGKSLLYQLPAVLLPGPTLVISPLLALMRDQLEHLGGRFGVPAASLDSDQSEAENEDARRRAAAGELKVLFVSPEQLDNVERAAFLEGLHPSLVVIDEAHCISTWGHDFRPAYREIARLVRGLRSRASRPVRVLALTATADASTEQDIATQLAPLRVVRHAMDRPNLALSVLRVRGLGEKLAWLDAELPRLAPALLYCATREGTEVVAEYLALRRHRVAAYHAGMEPEQKRRLQRAFVAGDFTAISATNALGMGIDKSDLRTVVHVDVPGSVTACYQEVGRAGRDGAPARGILLFDPEDLRIQEHFVHAAQPVADDFATMLRVTAEPRRLTDLKRLSGLHPTRVTVVVAELVEQGFLVKEARARTQWYVATGRDGTPDLSRYTVQGEVRRAGLARMVGYAGGGDGCLMRTLRVALGDPSPAPCGRCSACTGATSPAPDATAAAAWVASRPVGFPGFARVRLEDGRALFDSERRSADFVGFMRERGTAVASPALVAQLVALARTLGPVTGVVTVPSRTWRARLDTARGVAEALDVPVLDVLRWHDEPALRQGELSNNDQRKDNVDGRMAGAGTLPSGRLLLLDDYVGSGHTLREAARVLVKRLGHDGGLAPLAVARVRWRLGRPGIV
jgi:ATP-dependent DNA helicase RecQ